jgi:hypothetical protein
MVLFRGLVAELAAGVDLVAATGCTTSLPKQRLPR